MRAALSETVRRHLHHGHMLFTTRRMRLTVAVAITAASVVGCGVAPQPESARVAAAFEVPLPTQEDRETFLSILSDVAKAEGLHVVSASNEELEHQSSSHRMTLHAAVWRGQDNDEAIASARDGPEHLGRVWLTFSKGQDPVLNERFRDAAMRSILQRWPGTLPLPIMPTGAIPLSRDLIRTPEGYIVNPNEAVRYGAANESALP